MKFIIPGEPVAKGRPRLGKFGTYTPTKTVNYENLVKLYYTSSGGKKHEGMLYMKITAYFSIPKSTSKKKHAEMIDGNIRPTKKPDIDNIVKIIGDALNGIAYDDDSSVVSVNAEKYYSDEPRVEVEITERK